MTQYNEIAEEYSQMFNPTKRYVLIPTFKKIIGKLPEGKSILDLACGDGFFTRMLADLKPSKIIGIDISEELIKKAIETEKQHSLGIEYQVGDILKMNLERKFDLISAVYLLNYASTKEELTTMCKNIYNHLGEEGKFCTITQNPSLKPMSDFEYERRFTNINEKCFFSDGDKVRCEMNEKGKKPFEFQCYSWSKKTYENCLKEAGFEDIEWIDSVISKEGVKEYGEEYWNKFRKNPSPIGIVCRK